MDKIVIVTKLNTTLSTDQTIIGPFLQIFKHTHIHPIILKVLMPLLSLVLTITERPDSNMSDHVVVVVVG